MPPRPAASEEEPADSFVNAAVDQLLPNTSALGNNTLAGTSTSISRPLDINIDIRQNLKIWADQFVDFGTLLQNRPSYQYDISFVSNTLSLIPKTKPIVIQSMDIWNTAFQI